MIKNYEFLHMKVVEEKRQQRRVYLESRELVNLHHHTLGFDTLKSWVASSRCLRIGGEVTGTGDFCPVWDSSMLYLCIKSACWAGQDFLKVVLLSETFPNGSFFPLSFCRCQPWSKRFPCLLLFHILPTANKSLALEFFLDICFLEVPELHLYDDWSLIGRTIVQNRNQQTFCKVSKGKYFKVDGLHISSAT